MKKKFKNANKLHAQLGFTLLELLVALSIFSVISVMAYGGLQTVISTKQATEKSAERISQIQLVMMRISNDLRQAVTRKIRDEYGIKIDTATLNDVTGYTWALVDLFNQIGIDKIALRANSIRGLFTWSRRGAVPRPSYWEGPAGGKMLMWYTDSYREGDFFRNPVY